MAARKVNDVRVTSSGGVPRLGRLVLDSRIFWATICPTKAPAVPAMDCKREDAKPREKESPVLASAVIIGKKAPMTAAIFIEGTAYTRLPAAPPNTAPAP